MTVSITVPELGESILDATIARWLKQEGDAVTAGEALVELETDKINLEVPARQSGILKRIERKEQEDVKVGDVIGIIEEGEQAGDTPGPALSKAEGPALSKAEGPALSKAEGPALSKAEEPAPGAVPVNMGKEPPTQGPVPPIPPLAIPTTPVAQRLAREQAVDVSQVSGTGPGGRVTKTDVENYLEHKTAGLALNAAEGPALNAAEGPAQSAVEGPALNGVEGPAQAPSPVTAPASVEKSISAVPAGLTPMPARREERIKMSRRRRTIAQRLVEVQQTAAMLTTFNEVDMTRVMDLRKRRNEGFQERYGVKLGITSFFVKAAIGALKAFPLLNAEVQGDEMLVKYYYDIGVAVGSPEGLVVPVLRDADRMSFAGIETAIAGFVRRTDEGKLTLEDLRGGTFSITNGGVFGSLMSTPILTPPQVGILGLHKIEKRAVVVDDQVVIRAMMYLALSYDHRIVDGREAVLFLVRLKELIEDPEALLLDG